MFPDIAEEHWGRSSGHSYAAPTPPAPRPRPLSQLELERLREETALLQEQAQAKQQEALAASHEAQALRQQEATRRQAADSKLQERRQAKQMRHEALVQAWQRAHPWQAGLLRAWQACVDVARVGMCCVLTAVLVLGCVSWLRATRSGQDTTHTPVSQLSSRQQALSADNPACKARLGSRYSKANCPELYEPL